jgi:hypothetical protein
MESEPSPAAGMKSGAATPAGSVKKPDAAKIKETLSK